MGDGSWEVERASEGELWEAETPFRPLPLGLGRVFSLSPVSDVQSPLVPCALLAITTADSILLGTGVTAQADPGPALEIPPQSSRGVRLVIR